MDEIGRHNRDRFDAPEVVADYARDGALTPAETVLLAKIPPGSRILDLGCGTGRTTEALRAGSQSYLGIDCAPAMVATAAELHPDARFEVGDAADLSTLDDGSFDLVVFAYNGIDYLSDPDRHRCLDEVHRVLAPGGSFVLSTHSPRALVVPVAREVTGVRRVAVRAVGTVRRTARVAATTAFWRGEGWILDPARGGLHTHVAHPTRTRQELTDHGFTPIELVAGDHPLRGRWWRTPWWYHLAVRVP